MSEENEKSSRLKRFLRRVRELDDRLTERFGRFSYVCYRSLLRMGARSSVGWIALLLIAAILTALAVAIARWAIRFAPPVPFEFVFFVLLYVGAYIYFCASIVFALVRRQLRRHLDESQLAALHTVGRVVLTITGTAVFHFPFAWIAWRAFNR